MLAREAPIDRFAPLSRKFRIFEVQDGNFLTVEIDAFFTSSEASALNRRTLPGEAVATCRGAKLAPDRK